MKKGLWVRYWASHTAFPAFSMHVPDVLLDHLSHDGPSGGQGLGARPIDEAEAAVAAEDGVDDAPRRDSGE